MKSSASNSTYQPLIASNFASKNILTLNQFDKASLEKLFTATKDYKSVSDKRSFSDVLKGRVVTLLFYEPSSRTRGSFDTAVKYLGGNTLLVENPAQNASVAKGESLEDTIKTFSSFSDAIVVRHNEAGAALKAASVSKVPVINGGDGIGEHPTQALLDLFTIQEQIGRLSNLKGVIAGDLKNGRTVHSLLKDLALFEGNQLFLLSPIELKLDSALKKEIEEKGLQLTEISAIHDIPKDCDLWYWTRVQKERFSDINQYNQLKNKYVVTKQILEKYAGEKTILMHPLPRVGEIAPDVDSDPRAIYFSTQIQNGLYVRMALLTLVLNK